MVHLLGAHPSIYPASSIYINPDKNGRVILPNHSQKLRLRQPALSGVIYQVENPLSYAASSSLTITRDGYMVTTQPMTAMRPALEGKLPWRAFASPTGRWRVRC